jgi:ribonuclease D
VQIPHTYVDTPDGITSLVRCLERVDRLALDTEADSLHHYFEKVCLIQLKLEGRHFLVDPLAGVDLAPFIKALTRKDLVIHGADYDLRIMRATFGFQPRGRVFDTMLAAQLVGFEKVGLAALAEHYFGVALSKQGQKFDWSRRPLTESQLAYANEDTAHLMPLARKLEKKLRELGRLDWHRETCEALIETTSKDRPPRDPDVVWRIKGLRDLSRKQLAYVREIWRWRDKEARKADLPPFKIMGNQRILDLACWAATHGSRSLHRGPRLPRNCTGRRLEALKKTLQKAKELPASRWPEHRKGRTLRITGPEIEALRAACARKAQSFALAPSLIASRATLETIVRNRPRTLKEIMSCGHLTRWQASLLEPMVKEILK